MLSEVLAESERAEEGKTKNEGTHAGAGRRWPGRRLRSLRISITYRTRPPALIEIKGESLVGDRASFPAWPIPSGRWRSRNTLLTSWCIVAFIVILAFFSGRSLKMMPSGWQNFIESIIEGIHGLVVNTAGEKNGRRFFRVSPRSSSISPSRTGSRCCRSSTRSARSSRSAPEEASSTKKRWSSSKTAGLSVIGLKTKLIEFEADDTPLRRPQGRSEGHCMQGRARTRRRSIEAKEKHHVIGATRSWPSWRPTSAA